MGTGISSAILYNFPFPSEWLRVCSYIMFSFTAIFWLTTTIFLFITCIKIPKRVITFHCDPTVAPFMGAYAMGYNTIVNYIYFLTGKSWVLGTYCLWWIAVIISVYCAVVVFFMLLISKNKHAAKRLDPANLHATLLLPIVTLTVAASLGNIFCLDLPTNVLIISTMIISYILWSVAISMAFVIIAVYFWKLFVYKIPSTGLVFTLFLPVGVSGQGAYCIALFGSNMHKFIMSNSSLFINESESNPQAAFVVSNVILYSSTMISLFLTSFGYFCTLIAILSCLSKIAPFTSNPNESYSYQNKVKHPIKSKFNGLIKFFRAFWAMTFPLGTMSLANNELHKNFNNLTAFRVVAAMYGFMLIVITTGCVIGCFYKIFVEVKYIIRGNDEVVEDNEEYV